MGSLVFEKGHRGRIPGILYNWYLSNDVSPLCRSSFHGPPLRFRPSLLRGRFSASPATGLIGMLENELLGDFFECLGVLSLATGRYDMISKCCLCELWQDGIDERPFFGLYDIWSC